MNGHSVLFCFLQCIKFPFHLEKEEDEEEVLGFTILKEREKKSLISHHFFKKDKCLAERRKMLGEKTRKIPRRLIL